MPKTHTDTTVWQKSFYGLKVKDGKISTLLTFIKKFILFITYTISVLCQDVIPDSVVPFRGQISRS